MQELNRLPGIGPKSAQRLAYHIIRLPAEEAYALAEAVTAVKRNTVYCGECQNLAEATPCAICADSRRNRSIICVVEEPMDVLALERTRSFKGLYHVLHGVISPINGIGPDQLKLRELLSRLADRKSRNWWLPPTPRWRGKPPLCTSAASSRAMAFASPAWPGVAGGRLAGIHRRNHAEPRLSGTAGVVVVAQPRTYRCEG